MADTLANILATHPRAALALIIASVWLAGQLDRYLP